MSKCRFKIGGQPNFEQGRTRRYKSPTWRNKKELVQILLNMYFCPEYILYTTNFAMHVNNGLSFYKHK